MSCRCRGVYCRDGSVNAALDSSSKAEGVTSLVVLDVEYGDVMEGHIDKWSCCASQVYRMVPCH